MVPACTGANCPVAAKLPFSRLMKQARLNVEEKEEGMEEDSHLVQRRSKASAIDCFHSSDYIESLISFTLAWAAKN